MSRSLAQRGLALLQAASGTAGVADSSASSAVAGSKKRRQKRARRAEEPSDAPNEARKVSRTLGANREPGLTSLPPRIPPSPFIATNPTIFVLRAQHWRQSLPVSTCALSHTFNTACNSHTFSHYARMLARNSCTEAGARAGFYCRQSILHDRSLCQQQQIYGEDCCPATAVRYTGDATGS